MEGETSELEIDSELVMSFYDQYQADDLACKVYDEVESVVKQEQDSLPHHPALCNVSTSVIELKPAPPCTQSAPDVSSIHVSPSSCHVSSAQSTWNLPDLLVGLDGIATRSSSDNDSPPMMYNSVEDRIGNMTLPIRSASEDTCSSPNQLLTSTIPCISLPNLDLVDHHSGQDPSRLHHNNNDPHHPQSPFYFDTTSFTSHRGGGGVHSQTDSLLEGLGILSPAPVASVKTEMVSCSSPQPQSQFSLVSDSRDSPGGQITMDLSQLVSQHNIPQQFELSLSPKCEPGQIMVPSQTNRYETNILQTN